MPDLIVSFTKMEGAENDFIVVDNRFFHFSDAELQALARRWCPRRRGVGADGVLALHPPESASAQGDAEDRASTAPVPDFRMRYVNADGSMATMCGNGARCLARFAANAGLGSPQQDRTRLTFSTDAGRYTADVPNDPNAPVRLWVPEPSRYTAHVTLQTADSAGFDWHQVWSGTEHIVAFADATDALNEAPLETLAPPLRHDDAFAPEGTNVNLAAVIDAHTARMRTYEKGVEAETAACGTGVLAVAAAALQQETLTPPITIHTSGGTFQVGPASDDKAPAPWHLDGPARAVYEGTLKWTP
ncbi:diaminopimelate epimerase [Longimonas halophila]|uniref:Diaminopimelate epimerase n=1 Tax=Longimonas halophila TaxID=1469170 RepID=A0A2H3NL37_9BACT|nr:diaminopimelate epimerase [Longimonas halophila]PEN05090.1 diaminopimelate epimerase [Longimonas halophila]